MDKPLTLKRADFMHNLSKAINESGLPAFIIVDILNVITVQMKEIANAQYENDLRAFKEKESEKDGDGE